VLYPRILVYAIVIFFLFDLFDWGFRVADGLLNDGSKASQSPRPKAVLRWDLKGAAHFAGSFVDVFSESNASGE
jgi:hypothetical protein